MKYAKNFLIRSIFLRVKEWRGFLYIILIDHIFVRIDGAKFIFYFYGVCLYF